MEIQKKEIIIKPKKKKMDDSKNGDYFLFCRNKKCNQPIYKNRSHFDTRYCDECCQKGNMENNKWEKLVSKHLVGRKIVKVKWLSAKEINIEIFIIIVRSWG